MRAYLGFPPTPHEVAIVLGGPITPDEHRFVNQFRKWRNNGLPF